MTKRQRDKDAAAARKLRADLMACFTGGITWVDTEYREDLDEILRPLNDDRSGTLIQSQRERDEQSGGP